MTTHAKCPFCGKPHKLALQDGRPHVDVRWICCANCGSGGPMASTEQEAWEKWDRRDGRDPEMRKESKSGQMRMAK